MSRWLDTIRGVRRVIVRVIVRVIACIILVLAAVSKLRTPNLLTWIHIERLSTPAEPSTGGTSSTEPEGRQKEALQEKQERREKKQEGLALEVKES